MWAIAKFDKKKIDFFKRDLSNKLGKNYVIYNPKILLQKFSKKKFISKEFNLLGDYLLCFHNEFNNPKTIEKLKYCRGLKYFLPGCIQSQKQILEFINKCKKAEDNKGYLSQNFYTLNVNSNYQFITGPFAENIFKIINIQKSKIDILMGNLKTTIEKRKFLFNPA
jgi:hypothetical protein|tara:strand:+ start:6905 stop:7402 length:498 start_codon:yes stop_codon:yes gene_type:complete